MQTQTAKIANLAVALLVMIFPWPHLADAQQQAKVPRIGFLQRRVPPTATNPDPLADAFLQGLRDLGYIDGKNIKIEYRYAEGRSDRLDALIAEFLQLKAVARSRDWVCLMKPISDSDFEPLVCLDFGDHGISGEGSVRVSIDGFL
jgi:hypothetical protein